MPLGIKNHERLGRTLLRGFLFVQRFHISIMTENKSYSEKLKDPRWQKKRLEMLKSAGFKCESCGDTEEELHVHHVYYEKDRQPWDYPDEAYLVLCTKCHNKWHILKSGLDHILCKTGTDQFQEIIGIITLLRMMGPVITHLFLDLISGYHDVQIRRNSNESDF